MKSLRVVWVLVFLLTLAPLAVAQGLVNVRPHQPKQVPGEAGNPGKFAQQRGRKMPAPKARATGLQRPADPIRPGCGERDPSSGPVPPPSTASAPRSPVWLHRHEVSVSVVDGVAVTEIDQTFRNDDDRQMEGTYVCPLPPHAVINGFSIWMAGREVRGSVLEREKARRIYDRIVGRRRDPGLVELLDDGRAIRTSIFPIPPRGQMRVRTRYASVLRNGSQAHLASIPFPVATSAKDRPITTVEVGFSVQSSWPLRLEAPDRFRTVSKDKGCYWSGRFKASDYRPRGSLDVVLHSLPRPPGLTVNVHLGPNGTRNFVAIIAAGDRDLTFARLSFEGVKVRSMFPAKIPRIQAGRQALVFGQLSGTHRPVVKLDARKGLCAVRVKTSVTSMSTTAAATRHIPQFVALGKVNSILAAAKSGVADRQEVIELSTRYGILTRYTAFLAK